MVNKVVICIVIFSIMLLCGCTEQKTDLCNLNGNISLNDDFPSQLAGLWKSNEYKWQLRITPEGKLYGFVNSANVPIEVSEGGVEKDLSDSELFKSATFILGDTSVNYDYDKCELHVIINTIYYRIESKDSRVIEGNSKDHFWGKITESGEKWQVSWMDDGNIKGFPTINKKREPKSLIFEKVEDWKTR